MSTSGTSEKRYARLIAHARARGRPEGYVEKHHIVPRSAGGTDDPSNLVYLTAREHFLAHWLLYRWLRTPAAARAFKLMVHDQGRRRGRDYSAAREDMAAAMQGDKNVAKRADVRLKLKANAHSSFAGKKRPTHAALLRARGTFAGANNPWYGAGDRQRGEKNHMATPVRGVHPTHGEQQWPTMAAAAAQLGVSIQAISQSIRLQGRTQGWAMEKAA